MLVYYWSKWSIIEVFEHLFFWITIVNLLFSHSIQSEQWNTKFEQPATIQFSEEERLQWTSQYVDSKQLKFNQDTSNGFNQGDCMLFVHAGRWQSGGQTWM